MEVLIEIFEKNPQNLYYWVWPPKIFNPKSYYHFYWGNQF